MTKQKSYRQRCAAEGRCPHCGKPCAPYRECQQRRDYKRIQRVLRRGVQFGMFEKTERGYKLLDGSKSIPSKRSGAEGDRRIWPKIGDKPFDPEVLVMNAAHQVAASNKGVVSVEDVERAIGQIRVKAARR